jgi:signal transduction histidine kinase
LGHADAIAAWAAVRRDTALLARDPSTAADQAFDGDTHIDAAWTGSQARAQAAGVTLHGFRHPQPLGVLRGDAERMAAVLTHLLGASLDGVHGGSQGGSVQCKVLLDGGGLNVDVLDTGPGMDQGQLDAWFAAWDDAERWPEPDAAGLVGRRLVLARALVRGVGGRFDARSTPGHGNRFSAVLPCRPEPAATVASSTPANQPAAAA